MKVYTLLTIGDFHTNHCEDFLINEKIGSHKKLIAVLDGCTMGKESVFAAILGGKLLRKIAKKYFYEELVHQESKILKEELKQILQEFFSELKLAKNQLQLEINEMLCTLIIGLIDESTSKAEILTVGDGLIYFDGELTEYDQGDQPDYLAYHLDKDFESWYDPQKQILSLSCFSDLSICTNGVFTFKNLRDLSKQIAEHEIVHYLLNDHSYAEFDTMLEQKLTFLRDVRDHVVTDDLAIVRVINKL